MVLDPLAPLATDPAELRVGQLIGGKYRLEREIGRGAMGTVWAAHHESLGQRVAIKVISSEHAGSEDLRRRFDTEARAAAKLRSRFVVGVYDHGTTTTGLPFIVMEYLDGECLEDRIARQGTISLPEAARITRHVGRALSRAHAHGIVHRDLKPANIFLTKTDDDDGEWVAKVLDFGIAKVEDFADRSTTKTGAVLGTPLFMSPEQVRGASSVDARADLYSLGMVVYNMLTGTYAFEGQSFGDLLVSICTDPLPRLLDRAPTLPPSLEEWFQKTCARDAGERYQTADELVQAFSAAVGDTGAARLSLLEPSTANFRTPSYLAETYSAESNSEVTAESRRKDLSSASPSTLTVHSVPPPSKRPRGVWIGLGAVALVACGSAFFFFRSSADATTTAPPKDEPREIAQGEKLDAPSTTAAAPGAGTADPHPPGEAEDPSGPSSAAPDDAKPTGTKPIKTGTGSTTSSSSTGAGTSSSTATGNSPSTGERPTTPDTTPPVTKPHPPTTGSAPDLGF